MSEYKITCCSTADMSAAYFEEKNLPFVCFHFRMDGVEYPDDLGKSMAFDEFYKKISAGSEPTTAQVNTQQYMELFEPVLKEGKDLLIGFNPKFFIDALRVIDDEEVTLYMVNPKAPCFIKDDAGTYVYLILPVNFNAATV